MKLRYLLILTALVSSPTAHAADSGERSSPVDNNPACMDRTKDAASPECIPQTKGKPRHYVKPVKPVTPSAQAPAMAPQGKAAGGK